MKISEHATMKRILTISFLTFLWVICIFAAVWPRKVEVWPDYYVNKIGDNMRLSGVTFKGAVVISGTNWMFRDCRMEAGPYFYPTLVIFKVGSRGMAKDVYVDGEIRAR